MPAVVIAVTSRVPGCIWVLSFAGFVVGVAFGGAVEDLRGRGDLGFGGLQDRVLAGAFPGGECGAEVAVVGLRGGVLLALAVGEPVGERAVRGGQVLEPRGH